MVLILHATRKTLIKISLENNRILSCYSKTLIIKFLVQFVFRLDECGTGNKKRNTNQSYLHKCFENI